MADTATDEQDWNAHTFVYNVEENEDEEYVVEEGEVFAVDSVTSIQGQETDDYTVLYFYKDGDDYKLTGPETANKSTLDKRDGGMPGVEGDYRIAVVKGEFSTDKAAGTAAATVLGTETVHYQDFKVVKATKSLEGAYAFEWVNDADAKNGINDTAFKYDGGALKVGIALNGEILTSGTDYTVEWESLPVGAAKPSFDQGGNTYTHDVVESGTYTATLTGAGGYSGSVEVSFTVAPIDLSSDSVYVPATSSLTLDADYATAAKISGTNVAQIYVEGNALEQDAPVVANLIRVNNEDETTADTTPVITPGKYTFEVVPAAGAGKNVTGKTTIDVYVVTSVVEYAYGSQDLQDDPIITCDPAMNTGFDASKLAATAGGAAVGYTKAIYDAEGNPAADLTQPGTYRLVLDTPAVPATSGQFDYSYAGHFEGQIVVVAQTKVYDSPQVLFVSVDGKNISAASHSVEYTGEPVEPLVAVKAGLDVLVQGEDYAVTLEDAEGNAVEQIVEPGDYNVVATLNDTAKTELEQKLTVSKADIKSVKPAADFFATDGETAAVPSFLGYTQANCKGLEFALAADEISVKYYTGYVDSDDQDEAPDTLTGEVDADELTEPGWYWAQINIMTNAKYVENAANVDLVVPFQVLKTASFVDVPSDAWYAESVYKASQNGFMEGVASGIFAPERTMTRAEFAQTVYNMAHEGGEQGSELNGQTYPTQFSDVPADAWFSKAVEWAARYGIVTGKSATEFDPYGTVTREEIATMLYRYIGNGAKADASVLDEFEDKAEVCDWAVDAMAWAVEEGVVNGVSETSLAPHGDAQRCMVAAMAVRAQPERIENM